MIHEMELIKGIHIKLMLLRSSGFGCGCDCGCEPCWPKVCEWYVSHRRGLRIWGLSSSARPQRPSYQVRPSATPWWELVSSSHPKCLANVLPAPKCWQRISSFLPFPYQLLLYWTCGSWEQFWLLTLFSPVGPPRTFLNKWKFSHIQNKHSSVLYYQHIKISLTAYSSTFGYFVQCKST